MPGETDPSWTSLRWTRPGRLLLLTKVHGIFAVSITYMPNPVRSWCSQLSLRLSHSFLYAQEKRGCIQGDPSGLLAALRQGFRGEQVIPRAVRQKDLNDPNGPWYHVCCRRQLAVLGACAAMSW